MVDGGEGGEVGGGARAEEKGRIGHIVGKGLWEMVSYRAEHDGFVGIE